MPSVSLDDRAASKAKPQSATRVAANPREVPVFGIAARLPSETRLNTVEKDALAVLLLLMRSKCVENPSAAPLGCEADSPTSVARERLAGNPNVSREVFSAYGVERFSLRTRLGGLPAELLIDFLTDAETLADHAPDELILRGMPWFVLGTVVSDPADEPSEGPTLHIHAGCSTENIMCALSLEDAACFLRVPVRLDTETPLRSGGSRRSVYGKAMTQPGACAFLRASGGTSAARIEALLHTLEKGADILERRLDAARADVAQGRILEKRLLSEAAEALPAHLFHSR